jgi:hypothetical protein
MGTNNRPKIELEFGQEVRLQLIKDKAYIGENSVGKYYLYSVKDLGDGQEKALFATEEIHQIITEQKLGKNSEFILKRVTNGRPGSTKLEIALVNSPKEPATLESPKSGDGLKQLLLTCILDAAEIVKTARIQFNNDELQKLATTLFIQRTKLA